MKLLIFGLASLCFIVSTVSAGNRCYVCSSYMEQCKTYVDTNKAYAHRGECYSKCFTRLGEDGAIYRGCFDGFKEVPFLTDSYNGCKNQTWSGQTLPWCFCEGDLCNKASMSDMGYGANIDLAGGYRIEGHFHQGFQGADYNTQTKTQYDGNNNNNYVQQPAIAVGADTGNSVHQVNVQTQETSYGFEPATPSSSSQQKPQNEIYTNDNNAYAKEGVSDDKGFGIKEDNQNNVANQNQQVNNNKYQQDYYSQNGFMQSYYNGDYGKFHYNYQVEDPTAYMGDISPEKYIAMDESEGYKADIEPENDIIDNKVELQDSKIKDNKSNTGVDDIKSDDENTQTDDVYSKNDYVYNGTPYVAPSSYAMQPAQGTQQQDMQYSQYPNQPQYNTQDNSGLNEDFKDEVKPEEDPYYFPPHLAERIECAKTGFYQNPDDCRTFVACILDAHVRRPYMHLMKCPEELVWDNKDKICNKFSTTCNVGGYGYVEGSFNTQVDEVHIQPDTQPLHLQPDTQQLHLQPDTQHLNIQQTYEEPQIVHEQPQQQDQQQQQHQLQKQQQQLKHDFIKYAGERKK